MKIFLSITKDIWGPTVVFSFSDNGCLLVQMKTIHGMIILMRNHLKTMNMRIEAPMTNQNMMNLRIEAPLTSRSKKIICMKKTLLMTMRKVTGDGNIVESVTAFVRITSVAQV